MCAHSTPQAGGWHKSAGHPAAREVRRFPDHAGFLFRCATPLAIIGHLRHPPGTDRWRGVQVVGSNGPLVGVPRIPFEFRQIDAEAVLGLPDTALFSNRDQQFYRRALDDRGEATDWICLRPEVTAGIVREHDPQAPENPDESFRLDHGIIPVPVAARLRVLGAYARFANDPEPLFLEEQAIRALTDMVRATLEFSRRTRRRRVRASTRRAHDDAVAHARLFIARRCAESLSLERVASEISMSPHHFCRVFKERTGRTVHSSLIEMRLLSAVEAFEQGDAQRLTPLALRLGFSSGAHFSSTVSAWLGVRPSELKRALGAWVSKSAPALLGKLAAHEGRGDVA